MIGSTTTLPLSVREQMMVMEWAKLPRIPVNVTIYKLGMKLAIHIGNVNVTIYKLGIKLVVHIRKD